MERTNYVNRAKQLLLDTARTSALVIVPLAAACTAQASTIYALPTSNFSCTNSAEFACPGAGVSTIGNSGGIAGASFYTSSSQNIGFTSGGGVDFTLTMSAYGSSSGSLPASIPVDWDFKIIPPQGITISGWSLTFDLSDTAVGNGDLGTVTETGSGNGPFQGAATMTLASGSPSNLYETAILTVDTGGEGDGGYVAVDVFSGNSFDFNGAPVSSAPEPASVGLFGAGIAFMGALLRRRNRNR
jgi:hypothetical protein